MYRKEEGNKIRFFVFLAQCKTLQNVFVILILLLLLKWFSVYLSIIDDVGVASVCQSVCNSVHQQVLRSVQNSVTKASMSLKLFLVHIYMNY